MHMPAVQLTITWAGCGQALPHTPQWASAPVTSVSHPLLSCLSQLPNPASHEITTHALFMQPATACGTFPQTEPQVPQLSGSMATCVSQPLPSIPSQFL